MAGERASGRKSMSRQPPRSDVTGVFKFLEQISGSFTEPFSSMVRGLFP